jgi:hypothetical protein
VAVVSLCCIRPRLRGYLLTCEPNRPREWGSPLHVRHMLSSVTTVHALGLRLLHPRRGRGREDDENRTWLERRGQGKVPFSLRGMHGMSFPVPPSSIHPTLGAQLTSPRSRARKLNSSWARIHVRRSKPAPENNEDGRRRPCHVWSRRPKNAVCLEQATSTVHIYIYTRRSYTTHICRDNATRVGGPCAVFVGCNVGARIVDLILVPGNRIPNPITTARRRTHVTPVFPSHDLTSRLGDGVGTFLPLELACQGSRSQRSGGSPCLPRRWNVRRRQALHQHRCDLSEVRAPTYEQRIRDQCAPGLVFCWLIHLQ